MNWLAASPTPAVPPCVGLRPHPRRQSRQPARPEGARPPLRPRLRHTPRRRPSPPQASSRHQRPRSPATLR